jgi:hypothetical protein
MDFFHARLWRSGAAIMDAGRTRVLLGDGHVVEEGFSFEFHTADSSGLALAYVRGWLTKDGLTLRRNRR